jgi:hypothetical protein
MCSGIRHLLDDAYEPATTVGVGAELQCGEKQRQHAVLVA